MNSKGPMCWNCRETGHLHQKCPKPKKATGSSGCTEPANQVVEDLDKEAFGISDSDSVADSMPNLESITNLSDDSHSAASMHELISVSDSSDEGDTGSDYKEDDWLSDVGDNLNTPWGNGCDANELSRINSKGSSFVDVDLESVGGMSNDEICDSPDILEPKDMANAATDRALNANEIRTELYDSGTTQHISPYHDLFDSYIEIPPKSLSAVNKWKFAAIGKGDMVIEVPNGIDASKLQLTKVLYSPKVGYTLVLIGCLDQCRYTTTFSSSTCII